MHQCISLTHMLSFWKETPSKPSHKSTFNPTRLKSVPRVLTHDVPQWQEKWNQNLQYNTTIITVFAIFDSTLCCTISHPTDCQVAASSLSVDLEKITRWSNTWNVFQSWQISHSHCLSERTFPLKKSFHSSFGVSLSATIFPGKATSPSWPPKPVADWASYIV